MNPVLTEGDRIIVDTNTNHIDRGDIVIYNFPGKDFHILRIVGLPKEKLELNAGKVFVNGQALEETYVDPKYNRSGQSRTDIDIPDESYIVLGDNRDDPRNSGKWVVVPKKMIYGKYHSTYYKSQ